jgi:superfamily II DNA or RNA helicase
MSRYKIPEMMKQIPAEKLNGKRILSHRGYSIPKNVLTHGETAQLKNALTVKPVAPIEFSAGLEDFPVYYESSSRFYVPRSWGFKAFGEADIDIRKDGLLLGDEIHFQGELRPEQIEITSKFITKGANGIICVPCGWGKTFMSLSIMDSIHRKTLIVVHKEFLVGQWMKELQRVFPTIRIGRLQAEKEEIGDDYDVTIAMLQTVAKRDYAEGYFRDFGLAIFDECHHLGAAHFSKSLMKIQTKHMLGLSATPDRIDGLSKVFTWYLGDLTTRITNREADNEVQVHVYNYTSTDVKYTHTDYDYRGNPVRPRLLNLITEFEPRTVFILPAVQKAYNEGRKILILSDRREHLKLWQRLLQEAGCSSVAFYVGGMKQKALDESEKARILLGTYSMAAEAMNIPALNTIVLSTPKSNVEQSVGRILRQKKDERAYAPLVIDILDLPHTCFVSQFKKRKDYFKKCSYIIKHFTTAEGEKEQEQEQEQEQGQGQGLESESQDCSGCLFVDDA